MVIVGRDSLIVTAHSAERGARASRETNRLHLAQKHSSVRGEATPRSKEKLSIVINERGERNSSRDEPINCITLILFLFFFPKEQRCVSRLIGLFSPPSFDHDGPEGGFGNQEFRVSGPKPY